MNAFSAVLDVIKRTLADAFARAPNQEAVIIFRRRAIRVILFFFILVTLVALASKKIMSPAITFHDTIGALAIATLSLSIVLLNRLQRFFTLWLVLCLFFHTVLIFRGYIDGTGIQTSSVVFAVMAPILGVYFIGSAGALGGWIIGSIALTILFSFSMTAASNDSVPGDHGNIVDVYVVTMCTISLALVISVTLHQALLQTLIRAQVSLQRAQKAESERIRFFGSVSHEVRNSLNGIFGVTSGMLQKELPDDLREQIELIQASGNSLVRTLNDTLEVTRIEANGSQIEPTSTNLRKLLSLATARWQMPAEQKGLTFRAICAEDMHDYAMIDADRVGQILDNLISNAIKFTAQGDIEISLATEHTSQDRMRLIFRVRDTGIGVRPDRQEQIFEPYLQESRTTFTKYGGTGLGLYICRLLAGQMNGEVSVEQSSTDGSTFRFSLVCDVGEAPVEAETLETDSVSLYGLKVLAVDDRLPNRRYLETLLGSWDINIETVESGRTCLEMLSKTEFNLLLLDVNMPEMSGQELLARIRKLGTPVRHIPTIVITADATPRIRDDFAALGTETILIKPITPETLWDTLQHVARTQILPAQANKDQ